MIRPLPTLLIGMLLAFPAPALVIDSLAPNQTPPLDDPGFDNVGRLGVSTAVYLGHGWCISARHVPVGQVSFDGGVTFHALVPGSETAIAHDVSNDADLRIFRITPWPNLPALSIRSDPLPNPATNTTEVTMIGFGAHAGDPISVFPPPNQDDGYLWDSAGKSIRWGTNVIESLLFVSSSTTQSFAMVFDRDLPTSDECQAANGDSGGAVFVWNADNQDWELAGIMYGRTGTVPSAAVYEDQTIAADLSYPDYWDQIVPVVFPACLPDCPPCSDGIDNDGDGFFDAGNDPGCRDPDWFTEAPECDDGVDNDGDGFIDILDPTCGNAWQTAEAPISGCGLGAELGLIAVPLLYLRRRRQLGRSKT